MKRKDKRVIAEIAPYHALLLMFLFVQPVIDIYRLFVGDAVQIFGLALPELINLGFIAILGVSFLVRNIHNRKIMLLVTVYVVALVGYFVAHIANILQFDTTIINGAEKNLVKEMYFILRVYLVPMLYFIILLTEKIDGNLFEKGTQLLAGFISGIIVLTNLLGIGFITYASTLKTNDFITRTVLQWFTNPDSVNPAFMACKGWFFTGNQISIILFMLFPFVLRSAFKNQKLHHYGLAILQAVAMIMVGTKVSAVGALLVICAAAVIYLVFALAQKKLPLNRRVLGGALCAALMIGVLFPFSPVIAIQQERDSAYEESSELAEEGKEALEDLLGEIEEDENPEDGVLPEWDDETVRKFTENLEKYHNGYGIDKAFIDLFSVKDNVYFWRNVVMDPNKTQLDYRQFKAVLYEEVLRKNDNPADRWLGIGYVSNFLYTETDFVAQNVWFGYLGTLLLLGPYLACLMYIVIRAIKQIKVAFCYENALFAISLLGSLLLSLMAGHLFFGVFSIAIFAWLLAGTYHFQFTLEDHV